jgi:uncharacterized protein (TIGR03067 family)
VRAVPLLTAVAFGLGAAAPLGAQALVGKAANDAELKALSGTWVVESAHLHGRALKQSDPPVKYQFDGPVVKNLANGGHYLIDVDANVNPKRLTLTEAESKDGKFVPKAGGLVRKTVYDRKSDTLVYTTNWAPGADFPNAVIPRDPEGTMVMSLTRDKKK